ncbi:3-ketoacyl-CoA thiolase [compost metagenome]
MRSCMVGWSHIPFGRHATLNLEGLISSVTQSAIEHAQVDASRIDGIWVGNLNGGLVPDIFCSSLVSLAEEKLRWVPATRLENACASGSAAIYAACDALESGRVKIALVVGAESMTGQSTNEVTRILSGCSYVKEEAAVGLTFPGIFAKYAQAYFDRYGDQSDVLAKIAAKNHANGTKNPLAHMRKDLGFEFCNTVSDKNPMIAPPLRKTDCSLVSDGAVALVLTTESLARSFPRAVAFRSRAQVNDLLPLSRRDLVSFEGPTHAWRKALHGAGCTLDDLSLAEVHDCFTIAELLTYEAMGLTKRGCGREALESGTVYRGGRLPVNLSGGLKAKGHPIGATGVSMHVMAAMQLCSMAGDLQIEDASVAGVFNMGGAAVANYVSILERLH